MPAMFSNTSNFDDIDWNPSTGTMSNWGLPDNNNLINNNRRRRRDAADESQGARGSWRMQDNVQGGTWGTPAGTDDPASDPHPFRNPFSDSHYRQQQRHHTRSSRPLSTSHTDHHHISSIGNMNGHINRYVNDRTDNVRGAVYNQYRQNRRTDYNDDGEGSEDEPFFLEDQFSTARSDSNLHHHSASARSQYPPYPLPFPWPMYSHYTAPNDVYTQQHIPYGYPLTVPPHSNPTNNAAFFNTGKDGPKKKKKIHRRQSEDDEALTADWTGSGNGNYFNDNNEWGWPTNNNNGRDNNTDNDNDNDNDNDADEEEPFHRHTQVNARSQRRQNSLDDDQVDGPSQRWKAPGFHQRHVSSPEWGAPLDNNENDLDRGGVRIHVNGDVNSGGWYSSSHQQSTRSNIVWGEPTDNNAHSPGLGTLSRELTDLRLDQQRGSSRRRQASGPSEFVKPDSANPAHRQGVVWGDPTNNDDSHVPYTQPHANDRSALVDQVSNSPRRIGHQSTYPMTSNEYSSGSSRKPRNAYETHHRRLYADAFDVEAYSGNGGGSGFSTGNANGVASQLKEKAMKWLKGAGIGSITLHPILRTPTILRPSLLTWDVRRKPNPARAGIPIGEAMTSFTEPASKPPLQHMLVIVPIPDLPGTFWHMDVYPHTEDLHGQRQFTFGGSPTSFGKPKYQRKKSSSSASYDYDQHPFYSYDDYAAILCADVLSALTRMLQMSATSYDYHALPKPRQKQVYDAFILRCREMEDPSSGHIFMAHTDKTKNDPGVNERVERKYQRGLKRVDFLCGRTRWEGLEPNGVDSWTVKLGKST